MRSSVWVFGVISLSAVILACGSKPPGVDVGRGGDGNGNGNSAGASGESGSSSGGSDGQGDSAGATGFFPDGPDAGSVVCRTVGTCDALECGPIADGCGNFIQCGGCDAPAICGGAGVASHCGVPGSGGSGGGGNGTCIPQTCEDLGVTCGQQGDGCGGVVTCNPCANGTECVQGECLATTGCELLTCADYPEPGRCGPVSDGCSGTLDCSAESNFTFCASNERCGAQEPGFCGAQTCEPDTCLEALQGKPAKYCGFVSDGCAGQLTNCGTTCSGGETCGLHGDGGTELTCGTGSGSSCVPEAQITACTGKCGSVSDGCVSVYDCGGCLDGELCGANDVANVCGVEECVPSSCESLHASCGEIDDGCGGTLYCPLCPTGTCGGGGIAYECGSPTCTPWDHATACGHANANCGSHTNGCSGLEDCGTCSNGQSCGGGGVPNQCGAPNVPPCIPDGDSCAVLGWECGYAVNSCGDVYDCSEEGLSCNPFETCTGGIDSPTTCVGSPVGCDVCDDVPSCSVSSPTRLSGRVITPGRADNNSANQVGVPNAFVYILRTTDESDLPPMDSGIPSGGTSCDRCEAQDLGPVLTSAVTDSSGNFTLSGNIPVNQDFLLVTKVGKFRRAEIYNLPSNAACIETTLPATLPGNPTRLPRTMSDGIAVNIPRMAISTGQIDAMECVFEKMGIASSQFSRPQLSGRIKLFRANGAWPDAKSKACNACGTTTSTTDKNCRINNCDGVNNQATFLSAVNDSTLPATVASLSTYDMVVFDCEGQGYDSNFAQRDANGAKVREYVNRGGRMFASHLSMTWLNGNGATAYSAATPLATGLGMAASWDTSVYLDASGTGVVSVGRTDASPRIQSFADWMVREGVTTSPGYSFAITDPRSQATALGSSSEEFVYRSNGNGRVQQFSFNTPYSAPDALACGRVAYSGFHVAATGGGTSPFLNQVFPSHCAGNLTNQEKILLFMLFDLGACVGDEPEAPTCDPLVVCPIDVNCGTIADGCGGLLQCGNCTAPDTCGGGGTPNQCGSSCTLTTCSVEGATCGSIGDGCGGVLSCGTCPQGTACGGGGTANVCGTPACTPRTCTSFGATCGSIGDGCGRTLNCGTCQSPAFCGGGGANTCGTATCTPTGCGSANCGTVGDGCGNAVSCGTCPQGSVCGAGGPNKCGPVCTPTTCALAGNKNCGFIGDGCGGVLNCGTCSEGPICGGGGVANVCGGNCDATTCSLANANCGTVGDGCGSVLNCGTCPAGQVCGAGGLANRCGTGTCTPTSCSGRCGVVSNGCSGTLNCGPCGGCVPFQCQPSIDCGPVADGCGALVDCGGCTNGNTCGGGGQASKCGGAIQ